MQYRHISSLNIDVSAYGIGCMRLPLRQLDQGKTDPALINEKEAIRMIRKGIDAGVNYIDTAYPYHEKQSEPLVAKALENGYRDKVYLASKMPVWETHSYEDFEKMLDLQLQRLQTDKIDFYLLHALNEESWPRIRDLGILKFLDKAKEAGKIVYAAFSFHDELPLFKEIIDAYDWDMAQIQYNLLDEHYQAGVEGLRYATDKDIMTVIMEPLRGGALAQKVPVGINRVWDEASVKRRPVEWAFRWLADQPEPGVILSGPSSVEQLEDSLRIFSDLKPGCLSDDEKALTARVQKLYHNKVKVGCTACNYCMPCPYGVNIPGVFSLYNNIFLFDEEKESKQAYQKLIKDETDASQCTECGQCEPLCPQNIQIIAKLKEAHQALTG